MVHFKNESTIYKSENGELEVTNFRVCKTVWIGSKTEISRIFLENLSSSRLRSSDPRALLYLGVLFAGLSVVPLVLGGSVQVMIPGMIFGIALIGLYFFFRRQFLEFIGFGGEMISFPTKMGFEAAVQLLNKVEEAQAAAKARGQSGGNSFDKIPA